jgi:hypothetical protein
MLKRGEGFAHQDVRGGQRQESARRAQIQRSGNPDPDFISTSWSQDGPPSAGKSALEALASNLRRNVLEGKPYHKVVNPAGISETGQPVPEVTVMATPDLDQQIGSR